MWHIFQLIVSKYDFFNFVLEDLKATWRDFDLLFFLSEEIWKQAGEVPVTLFLYKKSCDFLYILLDWKWTGSVSES